MRPLTTKRLREERKSQFESRRGIERFVTKLN